MADNSSEPSSQDHQSDQCTSDVFTSSDNSESNLGDFDSNCESDASKSSTTMNHSFSRSGGVLQSPQLANNPFAVKTTTATKSLADSTENKEGRPIVAPATFTPSRSNAELEAGNCAMSSFKLKPAVLSNPFAKCDSVSERRSEQPEVSTSDELAQESTNGNNSTSSLVSGHISSTLTPTTSHNHNHLVNAGEKHQQNHVSTTNRNAVSQACVAVNTAGIPPIVTPADASFVFGQNMNERVTNVCNAAQNSSNSNGNVSLPTFGGSPELAQVEAKREEKLSNGDAAKSTAKSLHESAQEYESRKVKRTYDEVLVVTGEEEESNVLQLNCKLFAFDHKKSSWVERGRGLLRLNDKEESVVDAALQSRLVMRTQGSLRVVLNTKVWAGMAIEQSSPKSVRLTAVDGEGVKVFLVMASTKDAEQLFNALNWRVKTLKTLEEQNQQHDRFAVGASPAGAAPPEDPLNCQPSTTTSDDSSSSPKRRRVNEPDNQEDDSNSSEFATNIQDTSIDSTSRNKSNTFEADSGNLSSSSS